MLLLFRVTYYETVSERMYLMNFDVLFCRTKRKKSMSGRGWIRLKGAVDLHGQEAVRAAVALYPSHWVRIRPPQAVIWGVESSTISSINFSILASNKRFFYKIYDSSCYKSFIYIAKNSYKQKVTTLFL